MTAAADRPSSPFSCGAVAKVNERRGQLWLSADGGRLRVYHWTAEGPQLVREE